VSSKKRVYDLAKDYGMSGQELAAKLREMGFAQIKSHMTALADAELMLIEGRLDAYGFKRAAAGEAASSAAEPELAGLIVKRKKKRSVEAEPAEGAEEPQAADGAAAEPQAAPTGSAERAEAEPAPAAAERATAGEGIVAERPAARAATELQPQPRPDVSIRPPTAGRPAAAESRPEAAETARTESAPAREEAAAPRAAGGGTSLGRTAVERTEPERPTPGGSRGAEAAPTQTGGPAPRSRPVPEAPAAAAAELESVREREGSAPAATETTATQAQGAAAPVQPAAGVAAEVSPASSPAEGGSEAPATEGDDLVRPSDKRRQGKVVGFIDLSKLKTDKPVRRESRRHRSADDQPAPTVLPTLGRDRKRVLSRAGDVQRNDLTAAQLREREAGRFLRRARPGGAPGPGGPGGAGGRRSVAGRSGLGGESPHSGALIKVEVPLTIKKLAKAMAIKDNEVLSAALRLLGFGAVTVNATIDEDTAQLIAAEFKVELEVTREIAAEEALLSQLEANREQVDEGELVVRPPTIAILGHVDHGKTTLIDTIRKSQIASGESGGITQHIGAYQVETRAGHKVTILDTPGHAAFTQMRARGASAVDLVVLVVAADDGVMPQTEEAINHAKAANSLIVVAINKIDKAGANPDKVMNQLSTLGLIPEEWGGTTAMMRVSALKGDGIDELLERVFLESEVLELKCHPTGPAAGVVLEAEIQQGRGIVAHLLVQDGSLERGDVILAGEGYGKVRSIQNDRGVVIPAAGPSTPVEVSGLDKLPGVGERFHVVPDLQAAKQVAEERAHANRMMSLADRQAVNRENLFEAVAQADKNIVSLIVKADVQGSVEVLKSQLGELQHDEVVVKVLHAGVGAVGESDVDLAASSNAVILAFHVGTNPKARQLAERSGVVVRNYSVIYELLDAVRRLIEGQLSPDISEEITGHAEIRRVFSSSKLGNIAGCHVLDGKILRDAKLRLLRDGKVVFTGELGSLRREADDVREVREGFECGIVIRNYNNIEVGDVIEAYKMVETRRTI
jgi:translation initiation factor IF-2